MAIQVDRVWDWFGSWVLPPRCVLCQGQGQRPVLDLCAACEGDLPKQATCCPRCALPMQPDGTFSECARCRADPPPYQRCHVPFLYDFPLDSLVRALKYDGHLAHARVLGTLLGRSLVATGRQREVDTLLPVPLHPDKLVERGFNQSIEIARWVARETQRPCEVRTLARTRPTRPQVGLPLAERTANLHGAFEVAGVVRGRRVAVIDDVMTTGSTVREIAWALRSAGAASIDVWCVARTPE